MATEVQQPAAKKSSRRWVVLIVVAALAVGAFAFYRLKLDTYHYVEVVPGVLYRDGNQDIRRFTTAIERAKVKTVVPLIDGAELANPNKKQFPEELHVVPEHGGTVERIPVKLGGWPTTDDVRKFLTIAEDKSRQPVLVHCAQGVRRTGMMVAAYQMSVLGWDKAKAAAAIESFGHSDRTTQDIRKFIEIYDPATRTVTTQPAQSQE
jgi:protein tyrosine phosphatase (PTP) superfamily phosphohydrolase (DUF442 family)